MAVHGKRKKQENMALAIYNGLELSTRTINMNFRIKVNGIVNGKKVNKLLGVAGLIRMIEDITLVNKMIRRAMNSMNDKEVCKLRRGIAVSFYAK